MGDALRDQIAMIEPVGRWRCRSVARRQGASLTLLSTMLRGAVPHHTAGARRGRWRVGLWATRPVEENDCQRRDDAGQREPIQRIGAARPWGQAACRRLGSGGGGGDACRWLGSGGGGGRHRRRADARGRTGRGRRAWRGGRVGGRVPRGKPAADHRSGDRLVQAAGGRGRDQGQPCLRMAAGL